MHPPDCTCKDCDLPDLGPANLSVEDYTQLYGNGPKVGHDYSDGLTPPDPDPEPGTPWLDSPLDEDDHGCPYCPDGGVCIPTSHLGSIFHRCKTCGYHHHPTECAP